MSGTPIPVGAKPEVRIDPSDVGRRVSVRRIEAAVDPATGRASFRDVIGVLTSWNDHELIVVARDRSETRIPVNRLVAGKVVPLFPARTVPLPAVDPVELQRIAARGWPAVEQQPLGEWTLRASAGFTRRANSVQALGDPGLPLPQALDRVRAWYAERALPAWVEVTVPGSPAGLTEQLDLLGARYSPPRCAPRRRPRWSRRAAAALPTGCDCPARRAPTGSRSTGGRAAIRPRTGPPARCCTAAPRSGSRPCPTRTARRRSRSDGASSTVRGPVSGPSRCAPRHAGRAWRRP